MYDAAFYDVIRPGCQSSAAVIVPLLHEAFRPASVLDVGCGEGWFCKAWADAGVPTVVGLDGDYVIDHLADGTWEFHPADLSERGSIDIGGDVDVVTCLEVFEHLPAARAVSIVDELKAVAPVVVYSAAIPGQGGAGHVNEQWPAYWTALFERDGWAVSGALRWQVWDDDRVELWYRQNLVVATAPGHEFPGWTIDAPPAAVVHPILFDAKRR